MNENLISQVLGNIEATLAGETRQCSKCGKGIDITLPPGPIRDFALRHVTLCSECVGPDPDIDAEGARRTGLEARWEKFCPPAYRNTIPEKLPLPGLLERVLAWEYGPTGLLLHGETRLGKTRCAWQLIKREYLAGKTCKAVDAMELSLGYPSKFSESCKAAADWVLSLCEVDLLFFDDMFKAKITERSEEALFLVYDKRLEQCLPTITTLNDTAPTLLKRLSSDRSAPLLRRIQETCSTITFEKPTTGRLL